MRLRLLVAVVVALVLGALVAPRVLAGNDYSDPAYAQHDLDNISRSSGRHLADLTRPEWHVAMQEATAQSYLAALEHPTGGSEQRPHPHRAGPVDPRWFGR